MRHLRKLVLASVIVIGATSVSSFPAWASDVPCSETGSFTVLENAVNGDSSCAGSAIIPGTVTSIGGNAFKDATGLTSITIPSSVTAIGGSAFKSATGLVSVIFDGDAPAINGKAFDSVHPDAVAYIRAGATGFGEIGADWNGFTLRARPYDVTFDAQSGTSVALQNTASVASSPSTTRTGYTFQGWFDSATDGTQISFPYTISGDLTLYAQWTVSTYTVTFDANGGSGAMTGQVASSSTGLTTNTFTRDGFNFAGWNTAADGSGTGYAAGASYDFTSDETVYAQWTAIPAPAPAPLETTAPTPTAPIETVQAPAGSVEGSNETLEVASNEEGGSVVVKGEGWQLGVASKQKTGEALPANKDRRLIVQPETRVELAAEGLMPESAVAFWVFSEPTFAGEVQTDSTGNFEANMEMPDGLAPGDHTLQVLSRDSKGRVITLNFPIVVSGEVAARGSTRNLGDGAVKMYGKNIVGAGKVQFMLNGKEIAWVNATSEGNPKLRTANDAYYLVRTVYLIKGQKNILEVHLDGVRIKRAAYNY